VGRTRLAIIGMLAAALVAVPGAAAPALGAANLLPAGGFEGAGNGTLAGWTGVRADLTLRPDGRGGGHAARVARRPGARTYSIVASPSPVTTVAERLYRATGYLRSGRPGRTVCLKLLELNAAGRVVAQASGCRTATLKWRALPAVSYRARNAGDALSLRVVQTSNAAAGDSFQVDSLALTTPGVVAPPPEDPVIAAAGDIACDPTAGGFNGGKGTSSSCQQMATSDIIASDPSIAAVLTLGDEQYGCGGLSAFMASYDPSWGRFKSKTHPVPGNHEYQTNGGSGCSPDAAGYFQYFGPAAGDAQGDYAWNIGAWHMIALNGECGNVGGCDAGSPQGAFLRANLGAARCTLAYWHEPYYNGTGSRSSKYAYFWQTLYAADADIVLGGHLHTYARFAPQDAGGNVDAARGIREFIVGSGGEDHGSLNGSTNVEATAKAFGVLELQLHPAGYDWKMVSTNGSVLDSGTAACH
jgi:hypothetical protein